jgi:hypothetical protein
MDGIVSESFPEMNFVINSVKLIFSQTQLESTFSQRSSLVASMIVGAVA